jgi:hypothetical protein
VDLPFPRRDVHIAAGAIDFHEFQREKQVDDGIVLRSPEELYYYRIWRKVMPPYISAALVGRTIDRSAAVATSPPPNPAAAGVEHNGTLRCG